MTWKRRNIPQIPAIIPVWEDSEVVKIYPNLKISSVGHEPLISIINPDNQVSTFWMELLLNHYVHKHLNSYLWIMNFIHVWFYIYWPSWIIHEIPNNQ